MANKKLTKRALVSSIVALMLCFSMLLGTTYAWFTDSVTSMNNIIQPGNLDIELKYAKIENGDITGWDTVQGKDNVFDRNARWEPGRAEVVYLEVSNLGSLALKYQLGVNFVETTGTNMAGQTFKLSDYLVFKVVGLTEEPTVAYTREEALAAAGTEKGLKEYNGVTTPLEVGGTNYVALIVYMPESVGNEANYKINTTPPVINLGINLIATQLAKESDGFGSDYDEDAEYPAIPDMWDGTVDTSWYDPKNPQTEYTIESAEQLAGLNELCTGNTTFEGVTFTLAGDLDLYCEDTTPSADGDPLTFRPIGDHSKNGTFKGVFDGNGYTISNLYQNGWDLGYEWGKYGSYGLFGSVEDATIRNLTISGSESYIEGGDTSFIAGSAKGTCVFENITIKDSTSATYNNGNGGIIGWSGAGHYTFKNITIEEDCVLAGLWGSFDSSIGGIVGQAEPGATYIFENVDVKCRMDVYNDCTASYDYYNYRMCGMLIGRLEETTTIDGANYPDTNKYVIKCKDVTVTYGDWANYHYCEPTPGLNGGRGMRVEPGYSYGGLPADFDHSQCVDNHMNLIPFDQIFGGDQLGVKGLKTYEGVNIIYNNK